MDRNGLNFYVKLYRTTGKYPVTAPTYAMDVQMLPVGQEKRFAGMALKFRMLTIPMVHGILNV